MDQNKRNRLQCGNGRDPRPRSLEKRQKPTKVHLGLRPMDTGFLVRLITRERRSPRFFWKQRVAGWPEPIDRSSPFLPRDTMDNAQLTDHLVQEIRSLSTAGCQSLTQQSHQLSQAEEQLTCTHEKAKNLLSSIEQVKSHLDQPYDQYVHRLQVLKRLVSTCDILRSVIRLLQLSKRIQQRGNDPDRRLPREVIKTKQLIQEFEAIIQTNCDLMKIKQVEKEVRAVNQVKASISS